LHPSDINRIGHALSQGESPSNADGQQDHARKPSNNKRLVVAQIAAKACLRYRRSHGAFKDEYFENKGVVQIKHYNERKCEQNPSCKPPPAGTKSPSVTPSIVVDDEDC